MTKDFNGTNSVHREKGNAMTSTIILWLFVLTAGSIIGTFIIAILELNAIDQIPEALSESQEALNNFLP